MRDDPKYLLAIETSEQMCSAAIGSQTSLMGEISVNKPHSHNERLAWMVETLLKEHQLTMMNITGLFISAGPGSYTGLRIGFSFARGLVFKNKTVIIPVPTLEIYAFKFRQSEIKLVPVMDARRNEIYFNEFEWKEQILVAKNETRITGIRSFIEMYQNERIKILGSGIPILKNALVEANMITGWEEDDKESELISATDLYYYALNLSVNSRLDKYTLEEPLYVRDFKGSY